jgi:Tfp pilus assembly protein FimT
MVVIALIGIMAGVGAPALLQALPSMRTSGATRQVLSDLRLARTQAVDKGIAATVLFTPGTKTYVVFLDADADGVLDAGETTVKTVDLTRDFTGIGFGSSAETLTGAAADGVTLDDAGANFVTFNTNGSASSAGALYLMPTADAGGRKDRNQRVTVTAATGNLLSQRYQGTAWE